MDLLLRPKTEDPRPSAGMAKSKSKAGKPIEAAPLAKISQLDDELVRLVQERAKLVLDAAAASASPAQVPFASALDEESLKRLTAAGRGPLPPRCVRAVLREIAERLPLLDPRAAHRLSRAAVQLQPPGGDPSLRPERGVRARGHHRRGVRGSPPQAVGFRAGAGGELDRRPRGRHAGHVHAHAGADLRRSGVADPSHAAGKVPADAKCAKSTASRRPLSQCRNWLAKHLPAARTIEVTSTSTAAQLAGEKPGAAAIASLQAGIHYGLEVLAENIEDNPTNTTRFAVIGDHVPPRTGNDRTAMLFQVEHRPGTLADAMMIFKRNKLNLTWIESFPDSGHRIADTCSSWRWRGTRPTPTCAAPWRPWKRRRCGWRFSARFRPPRRWSERAAIGNDLLACKSSATMNWGLETEGVGL